MLKIPDLMSFLEAAYNFYLDDLGDEEDKTVVIDDKGKLLPLESFINWARLYLAKVNSPINITYLPAGLGLRLAQGQTVAFVPQQEDKGMRDEGIPITRPALVPGMHGISDTSGISITGR